MTFQVDDPRGETFDVRARRDVEALEHATHTLAELALEPAQDPFGSRFAAQSAAAWAAASRPPWGSLHLPGDVALQLLEPSE